jgi:hypothetical protein
MTESTLNAVPRLVISDPRSPILILWVSTMKEYRKDHPVPQYSGWSAPAACMSLQPRASEACPLLQQGDSSLT